MYEAVAPHTNEAVALSTPTDKPAPLTATPYQLLLWNVWNLPSVVTDGHSKTRAKLLSPLLTHDIIVLNEAFCNKRYILKHVTHSYKATLGRKWYKLVDSGLVILSRFPIVFKVGEVYRCCARYADCVAGG